MNYALAALWLVPLAAASLYVVHRAYGVYVRRIEDERRSAQRMSELHLADRKSTRLNSSHIQKSRMPSSA